MYYELHNSTVHQGQTLRDRVGSGKTKNDGNRNGNGNRKDTEHFPQHVLVCSLNGADFTLIPLWRPFSVNSSCPNGKKDLLLNKIPWKHLCILMLKDSRI